jgi:phospholipid transport system substrate-binding protein
MTLSPHAPNSRTSRRALVSAALVVVTTARLSSAAMTYGPEAFIGGLGDRVLALLGRPRAAVSRSELAALLDATVDLGLLARLALGRHWNVASETQRREYIELFRAYALQGLASAFTTYAGLRRFVVTGSRPSGEDDVLVGTDLHLEPGRPPYHVDWRVRQVDGRLVVVDLIAEGVSLLVTNREEFNSIVSRSGIDGLLQEMRSWYEEGSKAQPSAL